MTDQHLERNGASIAYDVRDGDGPVVVALHGMSSSRADEDARGFFGWRQVAEAGRTLVRYDARGHGRSTGRRVDDDWFWPHLADDLFALLDVVSPDAPVDAIGVSMGVGTLLHAATRQPERFRRLALVIPPTAWATRTAQGAMYAQAAEQIERVGLDAVVRAMAAAQLPPLLESVGWGDAPPDIVPELAPAVFRGCGASDAPDPEAVRAITASVLLRPWVGDPGHPVSTAERLHELLPGSVLEVTETPEQLRSLGDDVAAFLTS